jgi:hypothetical protein
VAPPILKFNINMQSGKIGCGIFSEQRKFEDTSKIKSQEAKVSFRSVATA